MNRKRANRDKKENGFEEFGGYMAAKRAKLNVQFNESDGSGSDSVIFSGVSININGYVNPTDLRTIFLHHGGNYDPFPSSATNFIIAENLSEATKRKYGSICVRPNWIIESIAAGRKLDHRPFLLYNQNEEKKQKTLTQTVRASHDAKNPSTTTTTVTESTNKEVPSPNVKDLNKKNPVETAVILDGKQQAPLLFKCWEDGFLEDFWARSRLHHISRMKRTFQQFVAECRRNPNHKLCELERFRETVESNQSQDSMTMFNDTSVMFLIDMDCFFVSVGLLTRPQMRNRPIVVTHFGGSKTISSHSDIACASYEARKFGVKNGMWVTDAKKLCPTIEVIPYDFDAYERVSRVFFETVLGLTLSVEPGSCDEMLVDVTMVLQTIPNSTPENLATFLRKRIFERTKCPASIGIGKNRLLAKLGSKHAKPDGIFRVKDQDITKFLLEQSIRDIPGIGWSLMEKLTDQYPEMKTCHDIQKLSMEELKNLFGVKTGEMIYNSARGIAERKLSFDFERPKSVSIDVNFGIRMTEKWQLEKLIMNMSKALCDRAQNDSAKGMKLVMSILTQQKGASEPIKLGGHGYCDKHNLSSKILVPTRDYKEIYQKAMSLISTITAPISIYRGLALALTGLKFDFDNVGARQQTLFTSMAKAQEKANAQKKIATENSVSKVINAETDDVVDVENLSEEESKTTSVKPSVNNTSTVISSDQIDLSVLASLPDDIASEVASFYGIPKPNVLSNGNIKGQPKEPIASTSKSSSKSRPSLQVDQNRDEMSPFDQMSQLDRSFLFALPKEIRQEVELDFAHVKLKQRVPPQPQEKEKTIKAINKSKVTLPVTSKPHQTGRMDSVPPLPPIKEIHVRDKILVKEIEPQEDAVYRAVRRHAGESTSTDPPFNQVNWWHFNQEDKVPTDKEPLDYCLVKSTNVPSLILLPALNEETDVGKIRNLIRDGMGQLPNPSADDVDPLMEYFRQLISGRFLGQTVILLKFLKRLAISPETNKCWSRIFQHIIINTQRRCKKIFGCPVELDE